MLNLKQFQLPKNILLIEEHPVTVEETVSGVHRSKEDIDREKSMRVFRTGVVLAEGELDKEILSSFSTKGEDNRLHQLDLTSLIGKTVVYMVHGVNVVDVPVEDTKRLVSIKADYLFSLLADD